MHDDIYYIGYDVRPVWILVSSLNPQNLMEL